MAEVWPGTLPTAMDSESYDESPPAPLMTRMDHGEPKTRKRSTSEPRTVRGNIGPISSAQVETLDIFYRTALGDGSLKFTASIERTGLVKTYKFSVPPKYTNIGGDSYVVVVQFMVWD